MLGRLVSQRFLGCYLLLHNVGKDVFPGTLYDHIALSRPSSFLNSPEVESEDARLTSTVCLLAVHCGELTSDPIR